MLPCWMILSCLWRLCWWARRRGSLYLFFSCIVFFYSFICVLLCLCLRNVIDCINLKITIQAASRIYPQASGECFFPCLKKKKKGNSIKLHPFFSTFPSSYLPQGCRWEAISKAISIPKNKPFVSLLIWRL